MDKDKLPNKSKKTSKKEEVIEEVVQEQPVEEVATEEAPQVETVQEQELEQPQEQQAEQSQEQLEPDPVAEKDQPQKGQDEQPTESASPEALSVEDVLVQLSYVSAEDMEAARKAAPEGKAVDYLYQQKKLTKDIVGQAMAEYYNLTYFDLNTATVPKENFFAISMSLAKSLRIVIVRLTETEMDIATDTPQNGTVINENLQQTFPNHKINMFFSLSDDIDEVFKIYREGLQKRLDNVLNSDDPNFAAEYFDELVKDAIEQKASDIHMEPNPDNVLMRFRVDGMLQEVAALSHDYYENILNRIKVLSNIRLDEHYRTQDGAIRYKIDDVPIDLRISIVPIMEGQKVVIRLLADYIKNMALQDLGLNKTNFDLVVRASKKTYGMILTTGPTGSGKTTTLYSLLKILNKPEVNVTTIEDPVEYRIPGVNQIQVNLENEITFARGLRSVVRQDPNIILVGEIRDRETVEIAVNAALTGHLLLSTFHANNASTSIPRLLDMGVEPFLLASTLNLIVAQRLVRRICSSCKYSLEYDLKALKRLMPTAYKQYFKSVPVRLYKGKGCEKCNFTGNKGRIGIFETIYVTEAIQDLILHKASSKDIWETATQQGAVNFFTDGLQKVMLGEVSLEELLRVAPVETEEDDVYGKKGKGN
ncbi:MAG TPA: GspE/PulE family protein [Candidatus Dojkabacteria bacterium]|nr:GspE/PulE family protein [Candidatus Dojkabacteria bacterium]